jgi:nucleotide-binding universal stress UspA family protein
MKPFQVTSILAPTDLTESSLPALRYARFFADRFSARLTVMHADPIVYSPDMLGAGPGLFVQETPEHHARLRAEVERHATTPMNGKPYEIHVTVGQPVAAILAAADDRDASLIVTGTHLRHGWRRALLGSVSEGIVHGSAVPVLTVAHRDFYIGAEPYGITKILCPVNFTQAAWESLHVAARLAEAFRAQLTVVHVVEGDRSGTVNGGEERIRRWIAPELHDISTYREIVVRGGAAERVLDCADDVGADLLVVGAQHKLFRDHTVIGATTERLIRFASSPVLIVPRAPVRQEDNVDVEYEELAGTIA